ncbi:MAG TPA: ChaN family lipoprotein, partial [Saprospiraceae bacterium]|nr:ChaN family lipoprotein [Saprospiraceae bacterium]
MKYTLLSILLTLVTFLQGQTYQVYNKNQESISFDLLASQLKDVDVVFFGEVHDDSIGHLAQLDLLQAIKKSTKNKVALSMEMFETDVQLVLNEYLEGKISEDVFVKDARAWPKYATDYKPLVEAMKSDGLHVIAANAPRRYVKMVTKNGLSALDKLSDQAKTYLAKLPIHVAKGK